MVKKRATMIEQSVDEQDLAFVRELEKHVNKWVAIWNYGSESEQVVASGETINEAREAAALKGFRDVVFFRAPSGERSFVPNASVSEI